MGADSKTRSDHPLSCFSFSASGIAIVREPGEAPLAINRISGSEKGPRTSRPPRLVVGQLSICFRTVDGFMCLLRGGLDGWVDAGIANMISHSLLGNARKVRGSPVKRQTDQEANKGSTSWLTLTLSSGVHEVKVGNYTPCSSSKKCMLIPIINRKLPGHNYRCPKQKKGKKKHPTIN